MPTPYVMGLMCTLLALGASGTVAGAQDPRRPPAAERDSLEARVRQRMGEVVRLQLGLNNDQMRKLGEANRRLDVQRRALLRRERDVRIDLRDEIQSGDTTRQAQVARLLDQLLGVQRERFEQLEAQQRELGTFLTPIQRARYFAIEEQIRGRMMEMREEGMRPPVGGGVGRPGGMTPGGMTPGGRPGMGGPPRGGARPPTGRP